MAELSGSIYQLLNQREAPLDPMGAMQQGQRSAIGQMVLQEQRRQRQVEEQTRALYRQYYGQGGQQAAAPGMLPQPGAVQETVNTPYSSDLQAMLSQYQQEGADVTPTPGARVLPGGGPQPMPGQAPMAPGASPQAGVDTSGLVRALYQLDPKAAQAAEKAAQESQMGQLEMVGKQSAMVSQVTRSMLMQDTQQAYEVGVRYLQQAGIPVDHLPQVYDRRLVEHYYGMATDAETRVKEAQSRLIGTQATLAPRKLELEEQQEARLGKQYDLDVLKEGRALTAEERQQRMAEETARHNRALEDKSGTAEERQQRQAEETARHNRAMEELQEGSAVRGVRKEQFDQEDKLRNDFIAQTKPYQTQSDFYGRIQTAAKDPSATGDLAMIYSYMKLLDPGSTVLAGEYATAQNAGSVPERIIGQYNRLIHGERLSPEIRKDFVDRSERLYAQATKDYERTKKVFEERAQGYGLNPANVTQDLGSTVTPSGPPGAPGAIQVLTEADITATMEAQRQAGTPKTRQQILDAARQKGMQVPER